MKRIGIDVGGTNTDAVLIVDEKVVHSVKRPTTADVTSALAAADEILIPLQCEWFGLEGLAKIVHVIDQIRTSNANPGIRLEGIVMTMFDGRTLLSRNADRSKLVRLLPPDARVAHKSGWYDGVANDVGIVTVDRVAARWVIAVFTENLPDAETGNQIVASISKAVYDAWAP